MSKGEATRQVILDLAYTRARAGGLESLTIGTLAAELHLSKSGLFAHFGSKEALQLAVLDHAVALFVDNVVRPGLRAPRGEPRLRALFDNWTAWGLNHDSIGGCLFVAAAIELDDRPGPVRDRLVASQQDWLDTLASAVRAAIREGHFRADVDPEQFAFDLYGVLLSSHHARRLMGDPAAFDRARRAFEGLLHAAHPS